MFRPLRNILPAVHAVRAVCLLICLALSPAVFGATADSDCRRLKDSCALATSSSDHRAALLAGKRLQKEADRANDSYYLAYALYYQGISNVILGNSAIGKSQLDKALELAEKADDDTLRLSIINGFGIYEANVHVNYTRAQQHFYRSLEYAVKIGDPLRQALIECNLAEIASIRRDTTGLKYARNCYNWGTANSNAHVSFTGAYHCANLYNIAGDHAAALRYNREDDLGRTAESDRMIQRGMEISDSLQIISSVAAFLEQKALNLERRGDYRRALEAYKAYKQSCDSSYAERQEQQINELRVRYDIDKREHEADIHRLLLRDEKRKTTILLTVLASVTLILLILGRYYWRQKRLYRKIVISNRESLAREEALMARVASLTPSCAGSNDAAERSILHSEDLFARLSQLMEQEKIYRDSNLTRDRLAELLGTNRTYLTQIITQHSGKGYYQFINSYRIKEAVKILSDPANSSYPLKALAAGLGFT